MSAGAPLIVVANSTLKDNHQEELAEELQHQGYAIWGKLEYDLTMPSSSLSHYHLVFQHAMPMC